MEFVDIILMEKNLRSLFISKSILFAWNDWKEEEKKPAARVDGVRFD